MQVSSYFRTIAVAVAVAAAPAGAQERRATRDGRDLIDLMLLGEVSGSEESLRERALHYFVRQTYFDILGQEASADAEKGWTAVVAEKGKAEFARRLTTTAEYRTRRVKELIRWAFSVESKDEDVQGHVQNWSEKDLQTSQIRLGLLGSDYYLNLTSAEGKAGERDFAPFLRRLYALTIGQPCPDDVLVAHDENLRRNPDSGPLIRALLRSSEFYAKNVVPELYRKFLRRDATPDEVAIHSSNLAQMSTLQEELFLCETIISSNEYQMVCNQRGSSRERPEHDRSDL